MLHNRLFYIHLRWKSSVSIRHLPNKHIGKNAIRRWIVVAGGNPVKRQNTRRHPRHDAAGLLRILWEDGGGRERISNGRLVNVSVEGIQLLVDEQIPIRSYVSCNDIKLGIRGRGSVRYCVFSKGKYRIGIEFSGGTGFREPIAPPE